MLLRKSVLGGHGHAPVGQGVCWLDTWQRTFARFVGEYTTALRLLHHRQHADCISRPQRLLSRVAAIVPTLTSALSVAGTHTMIESGRRWLRMPSATG
jgi:hypothetical protein